MPSATSTYTERRSSSSASAKPPTSKFPRESTEVFPAYDDPIEEAQPSGRLGTSVLLTRPLKHERWQPRKDSTVHWANGVTDHGRQKSLSDAFKLIRTRRGSVSQNAQEIAEALKAPLSPKLIVRRMPQSLQRLCLGLLMNGEVSLRHLVHHIGLVEHLVQGNPYRLP